jgi:hypothetical protein
MVFNRKPLIGKLLKETISNYEFSDEFFKKRIPFFKDYTFFKERDGRVVAQRVRYYENVKKVLNGGIYIFPQYNVSSDFYFYKQIHDGYVIYNFVLENKFHIMPPKDFTGLETKVLAMANNQLSDKLSYHKGVVVKNGEPFSELDSIINDINGKLFKFEEVTNTANTSLF